MYPFENEECTRCAACNCEVIADERAYLFGREGVLCFNCAEMRHGVYQEWLERWTVAPNIEDLEQRAAGEL